MGSPDAGGRGGRAAGAPSSRLLEQISRNFARKMLFQLEIWRREKYYSSEEKLTYQLMDTMVGKRAGPPPRGPSRRRRHLARGTVGSGARALCAVGALREKVAKLRWLLQWMRLLLLCFVLWP